MGYCSKWIPSSSATTKNIISLAFFYKIHQSKPQAQIFVDCGTVAIISQISIHAMDNRKGFSK
jgi:hypothetical protein